MLALFHYKMASPLRSWRHTVDYFLQMWDKTVCAKTVRGINIKFIGYLCEVIVHHFAKVEPIQTTSGYVGSTSVSIVFR